MRKAVNQVNGRSLADKVMKKDKGDYRRRALKFYAQFIKKDWLCYDVGANIGRKTEVFLRLGARVLAIEPQKGCMERLSKAYGRNPNVILVDQAVGPAAGFGQLTVCAKEPTISTMSDQWKNEGRFSSYYRSSSCEQVAMTTLDRLIDTYGRPQFCKIDVEGFEENVLQGLSSPIPCLSFEFTNEFLADSRKCIDHLLTIGPARFNCSLGDEMELLFEDWTDPASIYRKLDGCHDALSPEPLWGDIYVRFAEPEEAYSIRSRENPRPQFDTSADIRNLMREAIDQHGSETGFLEFLPVNRYNTDFFAATGQYDWFSGQLLYCLVRHLRPERILEISTASGYSTMFMALALRKNRSGIIDTCELDPNLAKKAMDLFTRHGLQDYVNLHIGDAKIVLRRGMTDCDIYFLDSLHTEDFARWFIETHVMASSRPDALFHMHDILPHSADIRFKNPVPEETLASDGIFTALAKRMFKRGRNEKHTEGDSASNGGYATYDKLQTSEAVLGHRLADLMNKNEHVFLHDIAGDYPQLHPRKYDSYAIGRKSTFNMPMEWNESWWCKIPALQAAYKKLAAMGG